MIHFEGFYFLFSRRIYVLVYFVLPTAIPVYIKSMKIEVLYILLPFSIWSEIIWRHKNFSTKRFTVYASNQINLNPDNYAIASLCSNFKSKLKLDTTNYFCISLLLSVRRRSEHVKLVRDNCYIVDVVIAKMTRIFTSMKYVSYLTSHQ